MKVVLFYAKFHHEKTPELEEIRDIVSKVFKVKEKLHFDEYCGLE